MRTARPSRGFAVADVLIGMAVVGILTSALTVSAVKEQRAAKRLAETRAAMRLAEATMLALQTGQTPPVAPAGVDVKIIPAAGGDAPAGCVWATVRIEGRTPPAELTGIVRADAMKGATP